MESMNCRRAFKILEIDTDDNDVAIEVVRKQYKILALKWHPDRNKAPDAAERYREIKDAHDYLLESFKETECSECSEGTGSKGTGTSKDNSYTDVASMFFETLYNNEHFQRRIFHPLLMKVTTMCEEKALAFILRLDADRATKLLGILETWKTTLHFSDAFFDGVREHIEGRNKYRCIVLNPNIDDLMQSNVCRIEGIIVPLWHSLLEYEKEGIIVHCLPELPENMWIDEDEDCENTLNIEVSKTVENIWKNGYFEISIGKEKKRVEMGNLRFQHFQIVELKGQGIPVPHTDDVFYNGDRGTIKVHLRVV
jgi:hypothetical protein